MYLLTPWWGQASCTSQHVFTPWWGQASCTSQHVFTPWWGQASCTSQHVFTPWWGQASCTSQHVFTPWWGQASCTSQHVFTPWWGQASCTSQHVFTPWWGQASCTSQHVFTPWWGQASCTSQHVFTPWWGQASCTSQHVFTPWWGQASCTSQHVFTPWWGQASCTSQHVFTPWWGQASCTSQHVFTPWWGQASCTSQHVFTPWWGQASCTSQHVFTPWWGQASCTSQHVFTPWWGQASCTSQHVFTPWWGQASCTSQHVFTPWWGQASCTSQHVFTPWWGQACTSQHVCTVALIEIRPKVQSWHPQLTSTALDVPEVERMRLDVHMYKYNDVLVIGTGPGCRLCTSGGGGGISVSATVRFAHSNKNTNHGVCVCVCVCACTLVGMCDTLRCASAAILCPDLSNPSNGAVLASPAGSRAVNTIITVTCQSGYRLAGNTGVLYCSTEGRWNTTMPSCERITGCRDPGAVANARQRFDSFAIGGRAAYSCEDGFSAVGARLITCLATGEWSGPPPFCRPVMCPEVPHPDNGRVRVSHRGYNGLAHYSCNAGYTLSGRSPRACLSSEAWSGQIPPECIPISCSQPPAVSNGQLTEDSDTSYTFNSTVRYQCSPGYQLSGTNELRCLASQEWSSSAPQCVVVTCPALPSVHNAQALSTDANTAGTVVTVQCQAGHTRSHDDEIRCDASGQWSAPLPACSPVGCGNPGDIANGVATGALYTYPNSVVYFCDDGYTLIGNDELNCQANGRWSSPVPSCSPVECPDPGPVPNAQRSGDTLVYNSRVTYTCNPGYNRRGDDTLVCQADGFWSRPLPDCMVRSCPDPGQIEHGQQQASSSFVPGGSGVRYRCDTGYELRGTASLTCSDNGEWSALPPECAPVSCGSPGTVANGVATGTAFAFGDVVAFSCDLGYQLSGSSSLSCLADGFWDAPLPTCGIITCDDPGQISIGNRAGESFAYNSLVSYSCPERYQLVGPEELTCLPNGQWDGAPPRCEIAACIDPVDVSHATREDQANLNFPIGSSVVYTCAAGYSMTGTDRVECLPTGDWSIPYPVCAEILCQEPGIPRNGQRTVHVGPFTVGSQLTYSCGGPYIVRGEASLTCLATGRWSAEAPRCDVARCPEIGPVDNGEVMVGNRRPTSIATVSCDLGHEANGSILLFCTDEVEWAPPVPSCLPIVCQAPASPLVIVSDGARLTEYSYLASITVGCIAGFELSTAQTSSTSVLCGGSSQWEPSTSCQPVMCAAPVVTSGVQVTGDYAYNSQVNFSCAGTARLVGASSATCLETGSWSAGAPTCQPVCSDPGVPTSGTRIGAAARDTFAVGSTVTYVCDRTHRLVGTATLECTASGSWSEAAPTCELGSEYNSILIIQLYIILLPLY